MANPGRITTEIQCQEAVHSIGEYLMYAQFIGDEKFKAKTERAMLDLVTIQTYISGLELEVIQNDTHKEAVYSRITKLLKQCLK